MKNKIQNLIKLAKEKGYVPKKKKIELIEDDLYASKDPKISLSGAYGFNQAIDSYNLEKIIELAYEEWKKDIVDMINKLEVGKPSCVNEEKPYQIKKIIMKECKEALLTNLKEE